MILPMRVRFVGRTIRKPSLLAPTSMGTLHKPSQLSLQNVLQVLVDTFFVKLKIMSHLGTVSTRREKLNMRLEFFVK